jgi:NAD(P)H-hydrate epimerase
MIRLTRQQVREIDRRASERYHIPGIVLMENAARAVADAACEMLDNNCVGEILILCGGGNNGGDGLAVARLLHNRGADVTVALLAAPEKYQGDALTNFQIVQAMGLEITTATSAIIEAVRPLLIIDAIFGTGLTRAPDGPFTTLVRAIEHSRHPVLAIDVPSGLDCDTGRPLGACVRASRTVTFVAEKVGFDHPEARDYLGRVSVGDIGCPRELIEEVLHEMPASG